MARFAPILHPQDLPPCAAYPIWVCKPGVPQHHPPALCIYPVLRAGKPSVKRNARVEHPYAVLAIGGKTSSDMLDFSRELSETMAAGQAAGMPGTHIIHFGDFQGMRLHQNRHLALASGRRMTRNVRVHLANQPADHILMIGIRTRTHGARNMRDRSA
jgi:hypothetical protein